jgi:hypothetical protein
MTKTFTVPMAKEERPHNAGVLQAALDGLLVKNRAKQLAAMHA